MSQLERLKEEVAGEKARKKAKVDGRSALFTYRPTNVHREALRVVDWSADDTLEFLQTWLEDGCTITAGCQGANGSIYVILRSPGADWKTSPAVSVWHTALERALVGLRFYLTEVCPTWPKGARAVEEELW